MWTRVADADKGGRGSASSKGSIAESWLKIEKSIIEKDEHSKRLLINGPEIAVTGLKAGPLYGWIIFKGKQAQLNGEFSNREGSVSWLNKFIGNPDNLLFDNNTMMW